MLVSAIVATRNRPGPLGVALEAIARQTHPRLEIIVVDDGSGSESAQANQALVHAIGARARYVPVPGNQAQGVGPASARNIGIRAAAGELIAFCDDDDRWCDEQHVESAVAAFCADASLDLVFANQEAHSGGVVTSAVRLPQLLDILTPHRHAGQSRARVSRHDCLIAAGWFGHMNTCVFRRELLVAIGGFWEALRYCEDEDLFVRAVDRARHVEYRFQTVSIHNVPDRNLAANASTRLDEREKDLVQIQLANHLLLACGSPDARAYAARIAGRACRDMALALAAAGNPQAAWRFARLGLGWRPSWKWRAYTAWLAMRAILGRIR